MISNSVGNQLNKSRTLLLYDELSGLLDSSIDSNSVVSINSDSVHSIAETSCGDSISSKLVVDGGRDRISVVSANK